MSMVYAQDGAVSHFFFKGEVLFGTCDIHLDSFDCQLILCGCVLSSYHFWCSYYGLYKKPKELMMKCIIFLKCPKALF